IERLRGIYQRNLENDGVELVRGYGRFVADRTLEVAERQLRGRHVLLATGGAPSVPQVPGHELGVTSDDFFEFEQQPEHVLIVGGGYVAVELAGVLGALGSRVTVALRGDAPLRGFDELLRHRLLEEMRASGLEVVTGVEVERLEGTAEQVGFVARDGRHLGPFDRVVWATGRRPLTAGFGLDVQGVALDERGFVRVDEWQDTSAPGVHAVGDVTGRAELTPVAIAAGRRLAERLFGGQPNAKLDYDDIPTVVFSHPPIGTVGLSEEQAGERFGRTELKIYTTQFYDSYMAFAHRRVLTNMKLVCVGESERVVGIHTIGRSSDELIQGFAVALRLGATKADLDRTVAIHPTAAEELVTMR
ncbi:MAG TPA: FAD-dependent oxidoreductase, partial [Polyangiaceae bacterium]|nr:FAD-dependent oxidoreductase [Polyangiaceae bacterium]